MLLLTWGVVGYDIYDHHISPSLSQNYPTSPKGLPPGTIWNDGGVLAVTPLAQGTEPSPDIAKQLANQDRTIQELKAQITNLRAPYWDSLTPVELQNLGNRLKQIPPHSLTLSCNLGQCRDIANSLMAAFSIGGWQQVKLDTETNWMGGNNGIEIIPGDETAALLKAAFDSTTSLKGVKISPYNSQISGVGPNQTVITIGLKPVQ